MNVSLHKNSPAQQANQPPGTPADTKTRLDLAVEGITCPACMTTIERGLGNMPGISAVSLNYTTHRLTIEGATNSVRLEAVLGKLDLLGYKGRPYEVSIEGLEQARAEKHLLRSVAVAGFATTNIMMMSIAVWSGNVSGMEGSTRDLLHWLSAIIALPAVAYAGQPFFQSAVRALRGRHLNMDVPISLAVLLAIAMSLVQTITHEADTYFDSAVMLLFFLLIGRYLDLRARNRTKDLGQNLLALQKPTVLRLQKESAPEETPIALVQPGDHILVPAGGRIGVDGTVFEGASTLDTSLITGESAPSPIKVGDKVYAGTLNLSSPLVLISNASGDNTLLAEMGVLIDKAMEKRGAYVRLADKAASLYAPVVHLAALLTLLGWLYFGAGWQPSLLAAIAVLIITCPCALGLAVPVVQVVATGALFKRGLLVHAGDALERAALTNIIVFDKTGTLTEPDPAIVNLQDLKKRDLLDAARLARSSHHVLARTIALQADKRPPFPNAHEISGMGIEVEFEGQSLKLGSHKFCAPEAAPSASTVGSGKGHSELWFRRNDDQPVCFHFHQDLKNDAIEVINALQDKGFAIEILSGDTSEAVSQTAQKLGIKTFQAQIQPAEKIAHIEKLRATGAHVMMIGDGLNDAAALQAANVSVAPASALDITQASADIILVGNNLLPLIDLLSVSKKSRALIIQNFYFAAAYNVVAIPLAVLGFVTPLIAALFMSGSSIIVILNALRAQLVRKEL